MIDAGRSHDALVFERAGCDAPFMIALVEGPGRRDRPGDWRIFELIVRMERREVF